MANSGDSWGEHAKCDSTLDPDIFFPPRDKAKYRAIAAQARAICLGTAGRPPCPVQKDCLWYAVSRDEQHGIWGGRSHRERNALVRKWQREYRDKMTLKEFIENGGAA